MSGRGSSLAEVRDLFKEQLSKLPIDLDNAKGGRRGRGWFAKQRLNPSDTIVREMGLRYEAKANCVASIIEAVGRMLTGGDIRAGVFPNFAKKVFALFPGNVPGAAADPTPYVSSSELARFRAAAREMSVAIEAGRRRAVEGAAGCDVERALALLMCIFRQNMISCYDGPEERKVAEFLPLLGGFFNHSCRPNAAYVVTDDVLEVRAIEQIAKGDEVTIAYVPLYNFKKARDRDLLLNFNFTGAVDTRIDASGPAVTVTGQPDQLEYLERVYGMTEKQFSKEVKQGDTRHIKSIKLASLFVKKAKEVYSPLHPRLFRVLEFLSRVLTETGEHKQAANCFPKLINMMDKVFPRIWFRKASVYGRAAVCYARLGMQRKARRMLDMRNMILRITRGTSKWDDGSGAGNVLLAPVAENNDVEL